MVGKARRVQGRVPVVEVMFLTAFLIDGLWGKLAGSSRPRLPGVGPLTEGAGLSEGPQIVAGLTSNLLVAGVTEGGAAYSK
jgi:hypothetical protein